MLEVKETETFKKWRLGFKDSTVRAKIASRIDRLAFGLFGDVKPVGGGLSELRVHTGPGYRIYFKQVGVVIIVLLCGGDKSTQAKDIEKAKKLAHEEGL
jgi:putative addiction module killer protein